ncbi:MAG: flagellar filament capping protein FliD [Candidatus Nitrospinota bacterium M3_3B_026]
MALSVDGLVSGLDTTSIISQLMELERRPIEILEVKQGALAAQKAAWQEVNSKLLAFESAADKMNTANEFSSRTGTFYNNNTSAGEVLTIVAGASTPDGSHDIAVSQLARAQKSASNEAFASYTTAAGASGTITIDDGTDTYNISVVSGDTLEEIKNDINASGAPVTASIINTGTNDNPQYKLLVSADETGTDNSFTISDITNLTFTTSQSAQDAQFTIDGLSVTKSSNTVTDVIYDATINLKTAGSGTMTFAADYDAIVDKVKSFVEAYNELADYIKEQFTYEQSTNTKGELFGNATLQTIQEQMRSLVTGSVAGIDVTDSSNLSSLSQVGLKTDDEDHLTLDEAKFKDFLKTRFDDVKELFVSAGSGTYTFVTGAGSTTGGTYDTRVVDAGGGVAALEMKLQGGGGTWVRLDQSGNFAYGQSDTILEGLILQTGTMSIGETGTMRISMGVAEAARHKAARYTEFSTEGLIFNQYRSIENQDKKLQEQIDDMEDRLVQKEENLKAKFVNLETLLSKLTAEQNYLNSQLSTLSKGWQF